MTSAAEPFGEIERLAEAARLAAIAAAESAISAVLSDLVSLVEEDGDERSDEVLSQDPNHAGDAARAIDAHAQAAARHGAERACDQLLSDFPRRVENIAFVGEESGTQTQIIHPRTLVVRFDPLDGTSNAVNMISAFGSVATIDLIADPKKPARHLGGAILGGEIDVAWAHWSPRSHNQPTKYLRPVGSVHIRSVRLGTGWRRLEAAQDIRDRWSVASVAASERRFSAFAKYREMAFARSAKVYHLAGNPMCPALLLGQIGAFVETQRVTLHDSAFLIPHWLLGGRIESLESQPLDYMEIYETNARVFNPAAKPIPPYIAYVGTGSPFEAQDAPPGTLPTNGSGPPIAVRRIFRAPAD